MSPGKLAAQCCHAARLSLLHYLRLHSDRQLEFIERNSVGSVVVLDVPDLTDLNHLSIMARRHRLPWALFVDSGHILLPHFDGSPIPTALAIGPAEKQQIKPLVRRYRCLERTPNDHTS
jgi:peptidyl-tRNA hydrolase